MTGSRQRSEVDGEPILPLAFTTMLERVMEPTECSTVGHGILIRGELIKDIRYADDAVLLDDAEVGLQHLVDQPHASNKDFRLQINTGKSKVMVFECHSTHCPVIAVGTNTLACVSEFIYLGSLLTKNNDCTPETECRINLASWRMGMLKTSWSSRQLGNKTKTDVLSACIFSRLLYAAETWSLEAADTHHCYCYY